MYKDHSLLVPRVVFIYKFHCTVKPVFKITWKIGTTWELRTVTPVPMPVQDMKMDLGNKTTSEFRTVSHSLYGVHNSQVPGFSLRPSPSLTYLDARVQWRLHSGAVWCGGSTQDVRRYPRCPEVALRCSTASRETRGC